MARLVVGVIGGFVTWIVTWFGSETILSAIWREFGAHQAAFQAAIENGGPFAPDSAILIVSNGSPSVISRAIVSPSLMRLIS